MRHVTKQRQRSNDREASSAAARRGDEARTHLPLPCGTRIQGKDGNPVRIQKFEICTANELSSCNDAETRQEPTYAFLMAPGYKSRT